MSANQKPTNTVTTTNPNTGEAFAYNQQINNAGVNFATSNTGSHPVISTAQAQFAGSSGPASASAGPASSGPPKDSKKRSSSLAFQDESAAAGSPDLGGDDDSGSDEQKQEKRQGRRKINIEFITDKSRRHITFSKRKLGIMKKAYELSTLTGTQVLLLVASETGHVYTFATPKLQPLITKPEGKNLIQTCLNAPDPAPAQTGAPQAAGSAGNVGDNRRHFESEDEHKALPMQAAAQYGFPQSYSQPYAPNYPPGLVAQQPQQQHHQQQPQYWANQQGMGIAKK